VNDEPRQNAAKKRSVVFATLCLLGFVVLVAFIGNQTVDSGAVAARHLLVRAGGSGAAIGLMEMFPLVALGLCVGMLGGMLGMGGGVILVAALLLLFDRDIFFARALSMVTMCLTACSALQHHAKGRFRLHGLELLMLLFALPATVGGVLLGFVLTGSTLTSVFGFFILFLGLFTLAQVSGDPMEASLADESTSQGRSQRGRRAGAVGALHGLLGGLLGISGGVMTTPMLQIFVRVPTHKAIYFSLLLSAVCTAVGAVVAVSSGVDRGDFQLWPFLVIALPVGVGAVIGAQLGARVSGRISAVILRLLFVIVSIGAGLSILL